MPLNMQRPVIVFYESDSQKVRATKLNELAQMMERRMSAVESKVDDIDKRVTNIEINT
jgi:hypothetical protein